MKMIKTFIAIAIIMLLVANSDSYNLKAQIPVTDVAGGAISTAANVLQATNNATAADIAATEMEAAATINSMKIQGEVIEKIQKATEYITAANSIIQLGKMIANMICTLEGLNLLLKKNGMLGVCHFQAHYQLALLDLRMATDLLEMVLSSDMRMDQGLRMQNIRNVSDLFSIGQQKIMKLSKSMQTINSRMKLNQAYQTNYSASASIYRY